MRYGDGVTNQYQYDSLNRLTNLVWNYASFVYQVKAGGTRTNLSENVHGVSQTYQWSYDNLYRLTNEDLVGLSNVVYRYDSVGNRTNRTSSAGPVNTYGYNTNDEIVADGSGNFTGKSFDVNGNTVTNGANSYGYDALNRLNSGIVNGNTNVQIEYDGDGNRVLKDMQYSGTTNDVVTFYLVDDINPSGYPQVLEEYQGVWNNNNFVWASPVAISRAYNYGLALISQQQFNTNTFLPSVLSYFGYDGHGSVRFLMDTNGTATDTYTYDAYGNLINHSGTTPNNYLYSGQQFDPDLGLYYNRARYLNTDIGRFWSSDSTDGNNEDPLSLHKYLYGADDPVDNEDPSGNDYGDFSIKLSTIFLPFLNTPMLAGAIINATGGSALNPTGLIPKPLTDADIDGQLNNVYNKIRAWEKIHGPVDKEPWSVFVTMMSYSTVDTIWYRTPAGQDLYQYTGTKYPRLLKRTFIDDDINYIGFGEGYSARGITGMDLAIRKHLFFDFWPAPWDPNPKYPSDNLLAAANTGWDWAGDRFWPPNHGPRHGGGN